MASTYTPIATTTLGSAAASVTLSSIPSTYTDLVLVIAGSHGAGASTQLQFNGDTGTNYSYTGLYGSGSAAGSARNSSVNNMYIGFEADTSLFQINVNIQNYANTTTYKTAISRKGQASSYVEANVGLWRSTAAINSVTVLAGAGNLATGSTFTLYGIKAA